MMTLREMAGAAAILLGLIALVWLGESRAAPIDVEVEPAYIITSGEYIPLLCLTDQITGSNIFMTCVEVDVEKIRAVGGTCVGGSYANGQPWIDCALKEAQKPEADKTSI